MIHIYVFALYLTCYRPGVNYAVLKKPLFLNEAYSTTSNI